MFKNGKITFTKEERRTLSETDGGAPDMIECHRDCILELMEASDRLPWNEKGKLKERLSIVIGTFPEEIVYKLFNKAHIKPQNTNYKYDADKLSDEVVARLSLELGHATTSPKNLEKIFRRGHTPENLEKIFNRSIGFIQNRNYGLYFDDTTFYRYFSVQKGFRYRTSKVYLDDMMAQIRTTIPHRHTRAIELDHKLVFEYKSSIISLISSSPPSAIVEVIITSLHNSKILALDSDLYKVCRDYTIQNNHGELKLFVPSEDMAVYFDGILENQPQILNRFVDLLSEDYIKENYAILMKKGDKEVKHKILNVKELQDENEKFLLQNPDIIKALGQGSILEYYRKNSARVINPGFVEAVVNLVGGCVSWDSYKHLPDFRDAVMVRIREEKKTNQTRKRTSVLTNGTMAETMAKILYEDFIEKNIEELVKETYHKYDTIVEDKIGSIIYYHADMGNIIENWCREDKTFKRFLRDTSLERVKYHLYSEIGNFARGSDFFIKNTKMIEKSIQQLRNVKKVIEG